MSRGKKPKVAPVLATRWRLLRTAVPVVIVLAGAAAILYGLQRLDVFARRNIGDRERYQVRFADLDCDAPAGMNRHTFLAEVRYVANVPDTFNLMADPDHDRLTAAFGKHPWVEAVEGIDVQPPARVNVRLRFRKPLLAIPTEGGVVRLVDATGVLLPVAAAPVELPEVVNVLPAPGTPAGEAWADDTVKRAVELVKAYHPRRLEKTPAGWRLTQPDGKVLVVGS